MDLDAKVCYCFHVTRRNEAGRFAQWFKESGAREADEPTAWEQNEYFDFF